MTNRPSIHRRWLLGALLVVNGLLFVAVWYAALNWQQRGSIIGLAIVAAATGLTLGQFFAFALRIALHPKPSPRHWLWALSCLALGSATFCSLQMLFDPWIEDRESFLWVLLARQIPALLSLTAVGIMMLVLLRLAIWPFRRLTRKWLIVAPEPPAAESRQYSLAEIFLVTAGVAAACWLGRSLFNASMSAPLWQGAALFLAALPTALFIVGLVRNGTWGRTFGLAAVWMIVVSALLMPLIAVANDYLDLLAPWTGWRPMNPWSVETLVTAAAFTSAVAIAMRANWSALSRCSGSQAGPISRPAIAAFARLTPPAARR